MTRLTLVFLLLLPGAAWAKKPAIHGSVVDRNGVGVYGVNVRLSPGNVELITDDSGAFTIDYLRDEEGSRTKLAPRTEYLVEYFKVGFHPLAERFAFKNGQLSLPPATLVPDSIAVKISEDNIDPDVYPDRTQSAGGSYEGE